MAGSRLVRGLHDENPNADDSTEETTQETTEETISEQNANSTSSEESDSEDWRTTCSNDNYKYWKIGGILGSTTISFAYGLCFLSTGNIPFSYAASALSTIALTGSGSFLINDPKYKVGSGSFLFSGIVASAMSTLGTIFIPGPLSGPIFGLASTVTFNFVTPELCVNTPVLFDKVAKITGNCASFFHRRPQAQENQSLLNNVVVNERMTSTPPAPTPLPTTPRRTR